MSARLDLAWGPDPSEYLDRPDEVEDDDTLPEPPAWYDDGEPR